MAKTTDSTSGQKMISAYLLSPFAVSFRFLHKPADSIDFQIQNRFWI